MLSNCYHKEAQVSEFRCCTHLTPKKIAMKLLVFYVFNMFEIHAKELCKNSTRERPVLTNYSLIFFLQHKGHDDGRQLPPEHCFSNMLHQFDTQLLHFTYKLVLFNCKSQ